MTNNIQDMNDAGIIELIGKFSLFLLSKKKKKKKKCLKKKRFTKHSVRFGFYKRGHMHVIYILI
jgi:hypothetical protein